MCAIILFMGLVPRGEWLEQGAVKFLALILAWLMVALTISSGAAQALNTTTIKVDREQISVSHGPIPLPGRRSVQTRDVDLVFSKHGDLSSRAGSLDEGRVLYYRLFARLKGEGGGAYSVKLCRLMDGVRMRRVVRHINDHLMII